MTTSFAAPAPTHGETSRSGSPETGPLLPV